MSTMHFEIKEKALLVNSAELRLPNLCFIREIGKEKGSNAKVYLADNSLLNRLEAIKIWVPKRDQIEVDKNRFSMEVVKNAKQHFTHVASFYDANIQNGIYYARIEYIPGQTLRDALQQELEFVIRYNILKIILETMMSVYEAGCFHGDIHADNVIINENNGEPYIIDFGTSFFSGHNKSVNRDCRMLLELSFETLPELLKLGFLDSAKIIDIGSEIAADLLHRCLLIIWNFETTNLSLDRYTYKEQRFFFDTLIEDFPFIDTELVYGFLNKNFSKE